ncbi:MAG TPA: cysteine desulfurase family protein [Desulfatiglandales bacterium]|nr:cysteine desulfurase family protein [Desulfatiglandales bacterium]
MRRVYLDHNATTPLDPRVFEAMRPYMTGVFGNASSPHFYGRLAKQALEESREIIASGISSKPEEIVFTSGGTEADNLALRGIAYQKGKRKGHVITSSIEHHAVLRTCVALEKEGFSATYLPVDSQGRVDPDEVKKAIRRDTVLMSVMFANNETGVIQPVAEIGRIAREYGIPFHCDAVQAIGKRVMEVEELKIDLLALSSHKIYGPQGIGALYVRDGIGLSPMITGGHHERGLRAGTENIAAVVGFARAVKIAIDEIDIYRTMVESLRNKLESGLIKALDGVAIHGAQGERLPHTSCIGFASVEAESILLHLDLKGIAASSGSACTTGDPEPSHVLTAMGVPPELAKGSIRISFGRENTEEEADYTVNALSDAVRHLRSISSQWTTAKPL